MNTNTASTEGGAGLPKVDPLLMGIARITNDIQIEYSRRSREGDEVLSSYGISELYELFHRYAATMAREARREQVERDIAIIDGGSDCTCDIRLKDELAALASPDGGTKGKSE